MGLKEYRKKYYQVSKGGPDTLENVQLSHPECNMKKRNHLLMPTNE